MKKRLRLVFIRVWIFGLVGCAGNFSTELTAAGEHGEQTTFLAEKIYKYEGEGFGGDFTIRIKEDGSFEYYEGYLSSYFGVGQWSVADGFITLTDDAETAASRVNHFLINGDELIFIEENSSNFISVKLQNGAVFRRVVQTEKDERQTVLREMIPLPGWLQY